MKKKSPPKRVVLGEGYPSFNGNGKHVTGLTLCKKAQSVMDRNFYGDVKVRTLPHSNKIRLVAEVLEEGEK